VLKLPRLRRASQPAPDHKLVRTGPIPNVVVYVVLMALAAVFAIAAVARADDDGSAVRPSRVFAIGDCVMLGASPALQRTVNGIEIDAAVSRQTSTGIDILRARAAAGVTEDVVIFGLGNNGPMTAGQIDDVMSALPGVPRVVFVTLTVPRPWEGPNNELLAEGVQRYPNAALANWHALSSGRFDLLWDDGIHLRPEGADAYAALVAPLALAPLPAA
jgi:hypothetical protein